MNGIDKGKYISSILLAAALGALANLTVHSHFWEGAEGFHAQLRALQHLTVSVEGIPKIWELLTSGGAAASLYMWLFEKWLWKIPWLQGGLVRFPNIGGTWVGVLTPRTQAMIPPQSPAGDSGTTSVPEWARKKGVLPVHVTIAHNFDKLIFTAKHPNSENQTLAYQFVYSEQTERTTLYVVYRNDPEERKGENAAAHKGCCELELKQAGGTNAANPAWRLKGDLLDRQG